MVNNELDFSRIHINDNNLQNLLENNNPSYAQARLIYNQLLNNTLNPLTDNGLAGNKISFVIILLEFFLRNTNIIQNQNQNLEDKIIFLERDISQIKNQNLEPIIQIGNKITEELKLWETGFQNWNKKFENFETIFETWNLGFQNFETNFNKLENYLNNFFEYWNNNTKQIENNLKHIEQSIFHWNEKIEILHNNIQNIEQNLINKQFGVLNTSSSKQRQPFNKLPNNNHNFTF